MIEGLLNKSKSYGFDGAEVMVTSQKDFEASVFEGNIDEYSISESRGLSFRGIKDGVIGYAYTEKISERSIELLLKEAMDNLKALDSKDQEFIFDNKEKLEYKEINQFNEAYNQVSNKEKIKLLKKMEKEAYAYDHRVSTVKHCIFGDGNQLLKIRNTYTIDLEEKSNGFFIYFSVGVKSGDEIQSGYSIFFGNDYSAIDYKAIVHEAVDKAVSLLGAKPIKSDNYPVIIENKTFASLLKAYVSIFSAEAVQKGLSLLEGKINQSIGNSELTIVDHPHLENKMASRSFDSEGVPTRVKKIVENGQLNTFLHNLKTANKAQVKSTGNAIRYSYKSSVGIAPSNFYIEAGRTPVDDMIKTIDKGLYIVSLEGLHAGINPVSGDFSLATKGFLIENGRKVMPVNQITISGNFLKVLHTIEMIGKDLEFGLPSGASIYGAPSIKVKSLTISGI
jgi:PmbA protein